ncbi:MAG: flagellar protein FlaG [Woeseiaceae bacterium]
MNPIDSVSTATFKTASSSDAEKASKTPPVSGIAPAEPVEEDSEEKSEATQSAPSPSAVSGAIEKLNELGESASPALQFELNRDTDVVVIKVINRTTGEVVRELPPEAVVDAAGRGEGELPALIEESV